MLQPEERNRFYVRLGKRKLDRKLAEFISKDRVKGVNVSRLMKQLLYNYYTGTPLPAYAGSQPSQPDDEARQSALSAKLRQLSFDTLAQT
jgi:hypothetical protein